MLNHEYKMNKKQTHYIKIKTNTSHDDTFIVQANVLLLLAFLLCKRKDVDFS